MYVVKKDGKWQVISQEKEVLVEDKFDQVTQMAGDKMVIVKGNQYGVLSTTGEEIIAPQYEEVTILFGDYYIAKKQGKYGVVNASNEESLPFEYSNISYQAEADFITAEKENQTQQELYNNKFEKKLTGIISGLNVQKGYFKLYDNQEYKYYNFKFEERKPQEVLTSNTLFLSKKDGKYGYVGTDGNVVVDYIYEDGMELNDYGYAAVKQNGKWGAIDKEGKVVVEPSYELQDNLVIDFIGKWHLSNDLNSYYYTDEG